MVRAAFFTSSPASRELPLKGKPVLRFLVAFSKRKRPLYPIKDTEDGIYRGTTSYSLPCGSLVGSKQTVALYRARPSSPTGPKAVWKAARKGISIPGSLCLAPTGSSLKGYLSDMYLVSSSRWDEIMVLTLAQDGCSVNAFIVKNIEKTYFFLPNVQYLLTRKLIGMVTARLMNGASHSGTPTISTHSASSSWFSTNAPPYAARDLKYMRT